MFRYAFYSSYFKFSINRRPKHPRYGIPGVPDIHIQLHMHIRLHLHIYIHIHTYTHYTYAIFTMPQYKWRHGENGFQFGVDITISSGGVSMRSDASWAASGRQLRFCLWRPACCWCWWASCGPMAQWKCFEGIVFVCVCGNQFWYVATIMGRWTSGCRRLCSCGILEMFTRYKALGACRDQHGPRPTADEPTILLN